jgi:putative FmdB family regulatory protein
VARGVHAVGLKGGEMPIYEFRCEACGERFDKLVRTPGQVPAGLVCPACQSDEVQRLISAPAIHSGGAAGRTGAEEAPAEKPPVFGRKELNEALKSKKK